MNYLDEEEVRQEILKLQKVEKLKELLSLEEKTEKDWEEINSLKSEGIDPKYKKTRYGEMCLLLIKRILTLPKFSGYTYKDDFTSNAITKLMTYAIKNYDDSKVSKISGQKTKVFAYLTQITMNAIIQVINERKEEQENLKNLYVQHSENEKAIFEMGKKIDNDNILTFDYIINFYYKIDEQWYKICGPREKYPYETSLTEGIFYSINEGDLKPFTDVYSILSTLPENSSVKIIYPHTYLIKTEEFNKIMSLKFKNIDIVRYNNSYVPSFPKKQKKEAEQQELDLWV